MNGIKIDMNSFHGLSKVKLSRVKGKHLQSELERFREHQFPV